MWYRIHSYSLCLIDDFISKEFISKPGKFCHPNTNMTEGITLQGAMQECHFDTYCPAFYQVCGYDNPKRFRKCNDTKYVEDSGCGEELGPSVLYIKVK